MPYTHNTFNRRIQLGAARERLQDAEALHKASRWTGAIYLAGYAIECSLKALVCFRERKDNFQETKFFLEEKEKGISLHNLSYFHEKIPEFKRSISSDRTQTYYNAWNFITSNWQKDHLRYWNQLEDKKHSEKFLASVKIIYKLVLSLQA